MGDPPTNLDMVIIYGASGHARVVAEAVRSRGHFQIAGFLDDVDSTRRPFCGAAVLGGGDALPGLRKAGMTSLIVAIGNCQARSRLAARAEAGGFELVSVVHPHASVASDARFGAGTFIAAGAVISAGASLGRNVIVNTCASVDHDCLVEDAVHVAPGGRLAGDVRVGARSWIGLNAAVLEKRRVGQDVFIGAGAVVTRDLPDRVVAVGVPAKVLRQRDDLG